MNVNVLVLGIIVFDVFAGVGVAAQNVVAQNVTVDCSSWPTACVSSAPVSNTGIPAAAVAPYTATFVYSNTLSQVVLIDTVAWTAAQTSVTDSPSTCAPINTGQPCGFTPQNVPGAGNSLLGFSVNVFFTASNGVPMGTATSQTFSVPIQFIIYYSGVGTITVTPPGAGPLTCTSNCPGLGFAYYQAYWTVGTSLTVTTSGGVSPVSWGNSPNTGCPAASTGSGFTCTFSVSQTVQPFIISTGSANQILVVPQSANPANGVGWQYQPTGISLCQQASGSCVTSGQFTITPIKGFSFPSGAQWQLGTVSPANGQFTAFTASGTSGTITAGSSPVTIPVSYTLLNPLVTYSGGLATVYLSITPATPSVTLTMLQIPYGTGQFATTTPAAGTYTCSAGSSTCQPGGTVQLSITIPSGQQFNGWIVNGQNVGTANPYTLTLPSSGPTAVSGTLSGATGCTGSTCTKPPANCAPSGQNAAIMVYVYDQGTNKPISGASAVVSSSSGQLGSNSTGSSGYTCVNQIAVPNSFGSSKGTVTITVTASGYAQNSVQVQVIQGQTASASVGMSGGSGASAMYIAYGGMAFGGFIAVMGALLPPSGPKAAATARAKAR